MDGNDLRVIMTTQPINLYSAEMLAKIRAQGQAVNFMSAMLAMLEESGVDLQHDIASREPDYAALVNYSVDLEPCQPSAAYWFDDRRHSKCKKHRREARGWR